MNNISTNTWCLISPTHANMIHKSLRALLMYFSLFYVLTITAGGAVAGVDHELEDEDESHAFIKYDNYTDEVVNKIITSDAPQLFDIIVTAVRSSDALKDVLYPYTESLARGQSFQSNISFAQTLSQQDDRQDDDADISHMDPLMENISCADIQMFSCLNIIAHMLTALRVVLPYDVGSVSDNILPRIQHILHMDEVKVLLAKTRWKNRQCLTTNDIDFGFNDYYTMCFERSVKTDDKSSEIKMYSMEMPIVTYKLDYMEESVKHIEQLRKEQSNPELYFTKQYQKSIVIVYDASNSTDEADNTYDVKIGYSQSGFHVFSKSEYADEGVITVSALTGIDKKDICTIQYFATDRNDKWEENGKWIAGSKINRTNAGNNIYSFGLTNVIDASGASYGKQKPDLATSIITFTTGFKKPKSKRVVCMVDPNQADGIDLNQSDSAPCYDDWNYCRPSVKKYKLDTGCAISGLSNKVAMQATSRKLQYTDSKTSVLSNVRTFVYVTDKHSLHPLDGKTLDKAALQESKLCLEKEILAWWMDYSSRSDNNWN
ncbi:MAG: hypothetical protein QS748_03205 [Candidatus Endonucleobacter bathymodioli]|uniref:Uncharacterized protein n=1 Tax=Candidatus Endonucleibacter bathymodioli TaxID=539814 RepID=A0AA90NS23_9GAMM|nr:hypothetical protein [Candidatus Endonucleobacter bathymodioli]